MVGLILIALPIFKAKDKNKVVTAHPSGIVAEICTMQATLYFYMLFATIQFICLGTKISVVSQMIDWIPFFHLNKDNEVPQMASFKLIFFMAKEMVGFIGMI